MKTPLLALVVAFALASCAQTAQRAPTPRPAAADATCVAEPAQAADECVETAAEAASEYPVRHSHHSTYGDRPTKLLYHIARSIF